MLCERCGQRPATVHFTEITNGHKQETRLCEVCAREIHPQGFMFVPQLNLHNFLAGLLKHELGGGGYARPEEDGGKCGRCGVAGGQFVKQGLLGCGDCYPYFEEKLLPLLRRIHGNTRHTGKVPGRTGGRARLVKEIENLKMQLKEAVSREEFERAAQLRDNIRQLEKRWKRGVKAVDHQGGGQQGPQPLDGGRRAGIGHSCQQPGEGGQKPGRDALSPPFEP